VAGALLRPLLVAETPVRLVVDESDPKRLLARLADERGPPLLVDAVDGLAFTQVPGFMQRPLHLFVAPAGEPRGWLHHLDEKVRDDHRRGWSETLVKLERFVIQDQ